MLDDYQEEQGCCAFAGMFCMVFMILASASCCALAAAGFVSGLIGN